MKETVAQQEFTASATEESPKYRSGADAVSSFFSDLAPVRPVITPEYRELFLAFVGSCLALGLIGLIHAASHATTGLPLTMAPFGASAVLVFGARKSPLAQPRNVIVGHVVSALVGVSVYNCIGEWQILAVCLAVPGAIVAMHMTQSLHPPGGATAFVAVAGGEAIHSLGYWYVLTPCALGSTIMVLIALKLYRQPTIDRYLQI